MLTPDIALDIHAHLAPVLGDRLAAIEGVSFDADAQVMTVDGHRVGVKALFQPGQLIGWMDENRVQHAWISVPPPLYRQHLRGQAAKAWNDYLNEGLGVIAEASNGRLSPLMHLPIQDPDLAAGLAAELIAGGMGRFAMPCGTGDDRVLSDPAFEPLWQVLDGAGAFVFFHPGECGDGRLKAFYLGNLVGNPYESTVAISHMVLGGILDRYSRLTACFAHGGGLTPMVSGRLQRGYDTDRPGIDKTVTPPRSSLRRLFVDCICHDEGAVMLAEEVIGESRVLFGSDWPFPMGILEPEKQMGSFAPERLERLFEKNPAGLLAELGKS